jgi:signal transduction histidine kinase/DNA-binding response OmpR family regulator/serine phosphatase RsbU (regulator of sigma subunit)
VRARSDPGSIEAVFAAGGAMGELMARTDWAATPIGDFDTWPQSLRTALGVCLESRFPMLIWWGPELVMLYNDAYQPILGTKHPAAMGRRGRDAWSDIWPVIGPMLESVMARSEATWSEDQLLVMNRQGYEEETYFTFSYSPIRDECGAVAGVFTAVSETTQRVLGARRLATLRALADARAEAQNAADAVRGSIAVLAGNPDVPAAAVHLVDDEGRVVPEPVAAVGGTPEGAPLQAVADGRAPLEHAGGLVLPVRSGSDPAAAVLVCATNPRRVLDAEYRDFLSHVAGEIGTGIAVATAREDARRRTDALASLDEAKTAFFSNVSHEFRTPLTLLLGPLEELLGGTEPLTGTQRRTLEQIRRNALRMQRLVDALLDFSRVGSDRLQPELRTLDLAALTSELVSAFDSAASAAGLVLAIDCPPLPRAVCVDPRMWETVVLNLVSNALKHTWEGTVTVRLTAEAAGVTLSVADTGSGIPESELPHLFERFYRVSGAEGRSSEGTGIGLALVDELVRLHGGEVDVASVVDEGSRFEVRLPYAPADAEPEPEPQGPDERGVKPFLAEVELWHTARETTEATGGTGLVRVLVVDDNADMREYLSRLLRPHFAVSTAADGEQALAAIERTPPDLVVTDVMMPRLDGVGLLQRLRSDPRTARLPVIVLSARSGEAAAIEGLDAGGDDYLVKPFTGPELLARVRAALSSHQTHEAATERAVRFSRRLQDLAAAGLRIATPLEPLAVLECLAGETLALLDARAVSTTDAEGRHASAGTPGGDGTIVHRVALRADQDREVGGLEVESGGPLDAADLAVLEQLALLGGGALERARLHAREHATVELLQRSLLPQELPPIPGVRVAVRYLPASTAAEVGGDWYDVVPLPDDQVAVVVGDVVGHGLGAAATMSHLRNVLHAYLAEGLPPGEAVARMHELVQRTGDGLTATLCCLVIDPARDVALVARAGHPSPVVVPADGPPALLGDTDGLSPALGVPVAPRVIQHELPLPPGATLLLYTDGLIERRDRELDEQVDRLMELAAGADADLDGYADDIVDGLLGDGARSDDVALLVLRRTSDENAAWDIQLPAEAESLAVVRAGLREWLAGHDVAEADVDAILVASNEALANSIEHAGLDAVQQIAVRARIAAGRLHVTLRDGGRWRTAGEPGMRGHGLALMRALTDGVVVDRREDGTRVELQLRLGER